MSDKRETLRHSADELRMKRELLDKAVLRLVSAFESETGLVVEGVSFQHADTWAAEDYGKRTMWLTTQVSLG